MGKGGCLLSVLQDFRGAPFSQAKLLDRYSVQLDDSSHFYPASCYPVAISSWLTVVSGLSVGGRGCVPSVLQGKQEAYKSPRELTGHLSKQLKSPR